VRLGLIALLFGLAAVGWLWTADEMQDMDGGPWTDLGTLGWFAGVWIVLVAVNAAGALADLLAQSLLQLSMPDHLRGRAGGAWVVAIGLAPLGQLQIGALASLVGVSIAFGASGLALVLLAGSTALLVPRVRRL